MPVRTTRDTLKWGLLSFAFLATVINYLNRQTLSVMAPVLLPMFKISATQYSRIVFAFMLAYTLMNGVSGRLLDRLGVRVGYALTITFWSAATVVSALARGPWSLGVFQFLLGMGEAGNYPAGVKLIAERFPAEQRSIASGIFNAGASIGAILAPPLLAWILLATNWRTAFAVIGLLGFVWLAGWLVFYREPKATSAESPLEKTSLTTLLRSRFVWQFTLSKVFSDPVWYFYIFWFPNYLKASHSFSLQQIGKTAWIPFFTATLGNLAGGGVFSLLRAVGISSAVARRVAILIFSVLMASAVFVGKLHSAGHCIALISVATFGYAGALANQLAVPGDVFPKETVASIWGFASMGAGIGGMIFSLATGWLIDHYSYSPVFALFGVIPVVAACLVWTLPRKAEPARQLQSA